MILSNKTKGYIAGGIAAASYGTNPLFALPLYERGMSPDIVLLFRYLLAIPIMGMMLYFRRGKDEFKINAKEGMLLFIMGMLMALSSLSLFMSYTYMDAGIASTLLFVYPIMVALIMAVIFKERLSTAVIVCILMAISGIGLLYKGSGGGTLSLTGTILVMISSLTYAIYIVGVNQSKLKDMPTLKVIFYVLIFGVSLFIIKFMSSDISIISFSWIDFLLLLGLAIFPTAISFICTTSAIHKIGPTPTAILGALEPVTALIIGVCIFGEILTTRDIIGIFMIIGAVSVVVAGENVSHAVIGIRRLFPRIRLK